MMNMMGNKGMKEPELLNPGNDSVYTDDEDRYSEELKDSVILLREPVVQHPNNTISEVSSRFENSALSGLDKSKLTSGMPPNPTMKSDI